MSWGGFALITGGGGGLGRASSQALAANGVEGILFVDINEQAAKEAAEESKEWATHKGYRAATCVADVLDEAQAKKMVEKCISEFGRLDYAINLVGADHSHYAPLADCEIADFERVLRINTVGMMISLKAEITAMRKQEMRSITVRGKERKLGRGSIVNMVSAAGIVGRPGDTLYMTSKHADMALTKQAAIDHGKDHIRINAICPAWTRSRYLDELIKTNPVIMQQLSCYVPIDRMAEEDEVADGIVFLAGPQSSYTQGTHLLVDYGAVLNMDGTSRGR